MSVRELQRRYNEIDGLVLRLMSRYGVTLLRITVGIVFFWFGALKLFPGVSPAEHLIRETITFLPMNLFLPFLACWEMAIGLGFITGKLPRVTLVLMLMQMTGAMSPLLLRPDLIWAKFPYIWTLEGQYVFKDIILVSAGMVIAAASIRRLPMQQVQPKRAVATLKRATQQ